MTVYGYNRFINSLPTGLAKKAYKRILNIQFNGYELYCLEKSGIDIDEEHLPYKRFLLLSKAVLGEVWFSEILGDIKNRTIEDKPISNQYALLFTMIINDFRHLKDNR